MNKKSQDLFFSIIIPSFNRFDEIQALLESLAGLDFPRDRFEVIVADDGSTDDTETVVLRAQKKYDYPLQYVRQENKGPGAARNLGMAQAGGDFFIFVDSDVTVPSWWLKNIDEAVAAEQADAFGGPDSFRADFPALLKAIDYSMTSFITTGGMRGKKGKKLAKFYPRSFNMGLSRALWQKIGGFGGLRHGQDIEFSNRIIKSGVKVIFIENAEVYHKRRTNLRRFFRQVFNWGVARINLYKIDNAMLEPLHGLPALVTMIIFIVLILALFFSLFRWIFIAGLAAAIFILLLSMLDSVSKYKQVRPALYLPVVMPAQIIGYGLGFIYNYIRRVIFGKAEKVGFKKNYYK